MEHRKTQTGENKQKSKGSVNIAPVIFLSIFAVLLAVAAGLLLRQVLESRAQAEAALYETEQTILEKQELSEKLNNLEEEYIELSVKYEHLEGNLYQERARINRLRQELRVMDPADVHKYNEKIRELEKKINDYHEQVRSMEAENQLLAREKSQIQTSLNQTTAKVSDLETINEELEFKVKRASYLTISGLTANGIRERRRGDEPTNKARRTDKIQACFTINENLVAPPGNRNFYIRIIDPANRALSVSDDNTFEHDGKEILYSIHRQINFRNEPQNVCMIWNQPFGFEQGKYNAVVFTEGREVGYKLFQLE